jgi:two-component system, cell cycle sensor histidine kinase and response regulator CckA
MESIETWRALLVALPDAAVVLNEERVVFLNELASGLFGISAQASAGLPIERLFPVAEERARLAAAADESSLELSCRGPDACFLADVRTRVLESSEPSGRLCVIREITMSRTDQRRYRTAAEMFELGVFDHDQITEELWGSARHRALYGLTPDEELSIPRILVTLHPEDIATVAPAIARAHDPTGDGRFDVEHRVIRPDGGIRWIRTRSQTFFAEIGGERRAVRTIGAAADQTARKETERERERLVAVLEETPDVVAIAAPDGALLYLNRSARALLGVADHEGLSLGDHYTTASSEMLQRTALPIAEREGVWSGDATLMAADGREVPVSLVVVAHFRGDDSLERYSTVARDLSREKELEQQLLQSQKMEAIGRLAGGVAHDFNNLLSVIMGCTDLALRDLPETSPIREELEEVLHASERAAALTRQMLAFSRRSVLRPRIIDVNEVLERMIPMLSRLIREDIELSVRLVPEIGNIDADPSQVEQVILNLVVNAHDAMPVGGKLTLETQTVFVDELPTETRLESKTGWLVMISVSDTGVGMDAKTKARIFEPFFTTKQLGQGTGLGLSTVFGIIKQSGGSIEVDSELGRGTIFKIYFPCTNEPATPSERPLPRSVAPAQGELVLVVEDELQLRKLIVTLLRRSGYRTLEADRPEEALALARAHPGEIDLLLTDVVLPGMSGKELVALLSMEHPNVRVLYSSGYDENCIVHHGVLEKDVHFLPKPITLETLQASVARALGDVE